MGFPAPKNERGTLIFNRMKELLVPQLHGTAGVGVYLNMSHGVGPHTYGMSVKSLGKGPGVIIAQAAQFGGSPIVHVLASWTYDTIDSALSHLEELAHSAGYYNGEVWLWGLSNPVKILSKIP